MNILVLSWRDPKHPLAGGAEQVMHQHMLGWIKEGWGVTLFSSEVKELPHKENYEGVNIVRGGNQYIGVQFAGFRYYLKNKNKFDLVVDQFHGLPFFTPLYVKKPILAVLQEVARNVWFLNPLKFPINYLVGIIGYLFDSVPYVLYKKILFMVGSQSAKDDLGRYKIPLKNITVVPHGVLVSYNGQRIANKNEKTKTITFLGTLSQDKGIMDALKTFKILSALGDYKFCVIGKAENDEFSKRLMTKVKGLGLYEMTKFWGRVDDDKKFDLLSKSYLLINPSVHEGWGLVNIEANATGTPVIAYSSQGLVDSVNDGVSGLITKSNTPEDLAIEIENLTKDVKRYKKLQLGAIKWADKFSWKKSQNLSINLIKKIVPNQEQNI